MSEFIPLLNFLSRWVLFGTVAWKAYKTRDKGWALLAAALFIGALDIETYILTPLGIEIPQPAYDVASKVPDFYIALLTIWGTLHLRYEKTNFNHVVYLSLLLIASYVWLFLLAINFFGSNFAVKASFPSLLLGASLIYVSYVLWNHVISRRLLDRLFPIGLCTVGLLNLTYPIGRPVEWYSTIAFFLAAVGRLLAAIGAFTFVFYPLSEPIKKTKAPEIVQGAYLARDRKEVQKILPNFFENDMIAVTRLSPVEIAGKFTPASMVFWITKAKEGQVSDNPKVIAISPAKLGILQDLIIREIERGYRIVYVDAFEYLVVEVGFQVAFKFLLSVRDFVLSNGGTLVLVANPETLREQEWKLVLREFTPLKSLKKAEKNPKE
ncbi:DUF835 domain-containing protein [Thermococcus gammatolerans]|uniref:DUF835 domain-containing protein n=1 Tax=Thermococcus gammatolerans (strain DSM 15229 / JCM 11827 / EJ3) TaxID=593117 RepID=C5A4I1_THEGJ|nr:DUF835 domain-containing protein [Thermococcus gammatolerans]ACS33143.1 Conserved hypothetical protein [Thermococcus gammatolerans EJ3]